MKHTLIFSLLAAFSMTSHAALINITGAPVTGGAATAAGVNVNGQYAAFIIDNNGDGFQLSDTGMISNGAALTVGATLDGSDDVIAGTFSTATGGSGSIFGGLAGFDNTGFENDQFGIVWFSNALAAATATAAPDTYGFVTSADWTIPAVAGTYNFGSEFNGTQFLNPAFAGAGLGGVVIPEPSTLLTLVPFLLLGLFVRRRRHCKA